jgi:outer membrane protein W
MTSSCQVYQNTLNIIISNSMRTSMSFRPIVRAAARLGFIASVVTAAFIAPSEARAQRDSLDIDERNARRERSGAGLTGGFWSVRGLDKRSGVDYSSSPTFEGYLAKGLDLHLALENTVGLWIRTQEVPGTGGIGGSSGEVIKSYIIPQFTAIRFYPVSRPRERVQPFIGAGAGLAIGIDDRETNSAGSVLGGSGGSGINLVPGFGLKGHVGTEMRGQALGMSISAKYQWIRFFQEVGGEQTFGGLGADIGFTYRFQYR